LRGVEKEWLSIRCEEKKRKRRRKLKVQWYKERYSKEREVKVI
jgi:hypothetical protein